MQFLSLNPRASASALLRVLLVATITPLLLCACATPPSTSTTAPGPYPSTPSVTEPIIEKMLIQGRHPSLHHPDFTAYREQLRATYAISGYAPRWLEEDGLTDRAREALDVLAKAKEEGLEPRDYDVDWLTREAEQISTRNAGEQRRTHFELGLSISLARLLHDLHAGRIHPRDAGIKLNIDTRQAEAAALIDRALSGESLHDVFNAARPRFSLYDRLKKSLAHYRTLAEKQDLSGLPPLEKALKPNESWRGVPALSRWSALLGDYPGPLKTSPAYNGELVAAVRRFQRRHSLQDDGVIGVSTYTALTTPLHKRIRQLELAMERMRWISESLADQRSIIVNVPQFVLWAFPGRSQASSLRMDVVVGKALGNNTPVLLDEIETVIFSPYWNVPRSIAEKELLPKLRANPDYLVTQQMELVGGGQVLAEAPTPDILDALARGEFRIRQRPGPINALGNVKFEFPNNDAIYMHDTPHATLFQRSRRDFSHGCIRLEAPESMAKFLLEGDPKWNAERIAAAMKSGKQQMVRLRTPVPVLIFYTTSIVDSDGDVIFLEDIYSYDRKLDQTLVAANQRQRR